MAYGRYIGSLLEETAMQQIAIPRVASGRGRIVNTRERCPVVLLKNGRRVAAKIVILAIGNFPPGQPESSAACPNRGKVRTLCMVTCGA